MPGRASSHTGSLVNRTIESGGSIGGNMKTGVIRFSSYPNITMGYFTGRVETGKCCPHDVATEDNTEPSSEPDPEADPSQDPEADPSQDPEADPNQDPEADPNQDPEADPNQDPEADPNQDPDPEAGSGPTWGNDNSSDANCTIVNTVTGGVTTICDGEITFQGDTLP
jgi:hypothetical protein